MASKKQRAFALTAALLFLFSTIAFSAFVVYSIQKEKKDSITNGTSQVGGKVTVDSQQLQGTKLQNFTPVSKVEKLEIIDTKVGDGEEVKPGATVTAHYTGALASTGVVFQSSHDGPNQPIPFELGQVIAGWTQGLPGMKVGGTRRLVIPAGLAYGAESPSSDIPPNSDLVFDIELVSVQNP